MQPTFVDIRYARVFPYPVDAAYAWLTDYRDDDHARAGAVVRRRTVVSREPGKVVLDGEIEILGAGGQGIVEVALDPPAHWTATIVKGRGRGGVFDYRLSPVEAGARLDVVYRLRVKRWSSRVKVWLSRPAARRQLGKMWDGFDAAMRKELGEDAKASSRVPA